MTTKPTPLTAKPLDAFHERLIRQYVAAAKREVREFVPGGTFEMLDQVLATLDTERAAIEALREAGAALVREMLASPSITTGRQAEAFARFRAVLDQQEPGA